MQERSGGPGDCWVLAGQGTQGRDDQGAFPGAPAHTRTFRGPRDTLTLPRRSYCEAQRAICHEGEENSFRNACQRAISASRTR